MIWASLTLLEDLFLTRYWFVSRKYKQSSNLALFTTVLAIVVILLGAYTRLTDAGLSCPDWPHCYGYLTAPVTSAQLETAAQNYPASPVNVKKAWTEMTHRYMAGTEGILILILVFSLLKNRKQNDMRANVISIVLLGLLCTQVFLGMLTVTEKLKPIIVLAHLLTGLSLLSVLWCTHLELPLRNDNFMQTSRSHLIPWFWLGLLVVAVQIALGGWVSSHYAGLACTDFPYCNGELFPTMHWQYINSDQITIHMLHRIGALITATYLSLLALFLLRNPAFKKIALVILMLVGIQITLGILNILWLRPVWIALTHQTVAVFLLLTLISALVKVYYKSWENHYGF